MRLLLLGGVSLVVAVAWVLVPRADADVIAPYVVVLVELLVLPWVVSAATNENAPASPMAPAIIQRLMRESSLRPRSRVGEVRGVMTAMVGAGR